MTSSLIGFIGWMLATLVAGAVGALSTRNARDFYAGLVKPAWAPPGWLFGPVWTLLYVLMGVAAWLVWRKEGWSGARTALSLFLIQLFFNALWSWIFFSWHRGGFAFAEILVLLALIVATMLAFARVQPTSTLLLVPYLLWVAFATALTYSIWRANPGQLS